MTLPLALTIESERFSAKSLSARVCRHCTFNIMICISISLRHDHIYIHIDIIVGMMTSWIGFRIVVFNYTIYLYQPDFPKRVLSRIKQRCFTTIILTTVRSNYSSSKSLLHTTWKLTHSRLVANLQINKKIRANKNFLKLSK